MLNRSSWTDRTMPKIFDPFKLSSAVRPQYWARRQRRASTELVVSTVCTMTSSGQAAHSISQTLTKTLAFHSSRFSFRRPQCLSLRDGSNAVFDVAVQRPHDADAREHRRAARRRDQDQRHCRLPPDDRHDDRRGTRRDRRLCNLGPLKRSDGTARQKKFSGPVCVLGWGSAASWLGLVP
jgi:hypothetical protein